MIKNEVTSVEESLKSINHASLDILIFYSSILAVISVPFSIGRFTITGWNSAFNVHITCVVIVVILSFFRKQLSFTQKKFIALICSLLMAIAGILSFGIVGNGLLWGMFSLLICLFFFNIRVSIISLIILIIAFVYSFYSFVVLKSPFPGDANLYANSAIAWGLSLIGAAAFIILIIVSLMQQRKNIINLLEEQEKQKSIIEEQKKKIEYQANHDALTGLPALRLADDRLNVALQIASRTRKNVALIYLDLDGFKLINDTYGHIAGDYVLKTISQRILHTIRESDTACRIGGDEFMIILNEIKDKESIEDLCRRLIKNINANINFNNITLSIGASIGISIYPTDAKTPQSMRLFADKLMYKAKNSGKNNYQLSC